MTHCFLLKKGASVLRVTYSRLIYNCDVLCVSSRTVLRIAFLLKNDGWCLAEQLQMSLLYRADAEEIWNPKGRVCSSRRKSIVALIPLREKWKNETSTTQVWVNQRIITNSSANRPLLIIITDDPQRRIRNNIIIAASDRWRPWRQRFVQLSRRVLRTMIKSIRKSFVERSQPWLQRYFFSQLRPAPRRTRRRRRRRPGRF